MKIDICNTNRRYDIFYTDPPWPQTKGNPRKCRPRQGRELDYRTMSLPEIQSLHRRVLQELSNPQHNVFLWTIDKYLLEAEQMMKEAGYTLHARFIWDKCSGIAPAFTIRFCHEYLLWFYKRGNMLMPCKEQRGKYSTVMREPSTTHSTKPVCAYEMLENLFPGSSKLELFARHTRKGWDCWGEEAGEDT